MVSLAGDVIASYGRRTGSDVLQSRQHLEGRRLAGSIHAKQAEDLAARYAQRDAVDGDVRGVCAGPHCARRRVGLRELVEYDNIAASSLSRRHRTDATPFLFHVVVAVQSGADWSQFRRLE